MSVNLSAWAIKNRTLVRFAMLVLALVGIFSYQKLGQSEDPPFTFRVMVVQTYWPGATAAEVSQQVTDRIEKKLLETGQYEFLRSYSKPGESMVMFMAKDAMTSDHVPELWYQVRKKVGDIRHTLPQGVQGPFFNDEFGDTFGNIYALSGDGFDYATLKNYAERIELELHRVPDVAKVELVGLQNEKIWINLSNTKLATLGLSMYQVQQAIDAQNAVNSSSFFETETDRVQLRVSGGFQSIDEIRNFPVRANGRNFRLGEIAEVSRGFADPAAPKMRFLGKPGIGIAVSMRKGGDIIALGEQLETEFQRLQKTLPSGILLEKVSDQPAVVKHSVREFVRVLAEAVIIVLLVSFFSLGKRPGLIVALSIPLVLAMTFATMYYFGIGLHKISLGALILALGLLVDDAIIAVEMMAIKMEQGFDRLSAAAFAYTSTAFPMLTGTLITAAGFLPIATANSSTGEYTRSIFQVVTIALLLSWIVAVIFIPFLGYRLLPDAHTADTPSERKPSRFKERISHLLPARAQAWLAESGATHQDPYGTPFYHQLKQWVGWCLQHRRAVILGTIAAFVASVLLFRFIPQQFFPSSTRLELMVDVELAEGASLKDTQRITERLERELAKRKDLVNYVSHIGASSPRFYLPLDQKLPQANFAQFVILTKDIESRERTRTWLIQLMHEKFPTVQTRVWRLENGPPVGYPIQFRVSGEHIDEVKRLAHAVANKVRANPHVVNVNLDWDEPSKIVRLNIDQDRARALGITSTHLAAFLRGSLSGTTVSTYREGNELIEILLRGPDNERANLDLLDSLSVPVDSGASVPLSQIASLEYTMEDGIIWHRNRLPTITVRADIYDETAPPTVTAQILPELESIRAALPNGYLLETGGTVEDSDRGSKSVAAGIPLFLLVVMTLLMLQLRSFRRAFMVLLTAPLGLIGVTAFLLIFRVPFGFVAMLGTIALSGMIMRNSVILVDQIDHDIRAGSAPYAAIIDATVRRFRPIVLTALAAVLAMIPLSRSVFFGPMAVAIMGGLIVATALTVFFLPALYAAWFKVECDTPAQSVP
ncbi:efflux RND transporter permease subunit [Arenimonas sp.]|jgi:multidrug efflux pump|uniref:efflux RND transporter permease subunit n=1 Tax=Arenimonas sp. TaxID=1872635 RepID=UPI0037BF98ED